LEIRSGAGGTLARDDKEGCFFQGDQFEGFQLDKDHPRGVWQPDSPATNSRTITHCTIDEIRIVKKSFGSGPEGERSRRSTSVSNRDTTVLVPEDLCLARGTSDAAGARTGPAAPGSPDVVGRRLELLALLLAGQADIRPPEMSAAGTGRIIGSRAGGSTPIVTMPQEKWGE